VLQVHYPRLSKIDRKCGEIFHNEL
jgi:hypothetical protein